LEHLQQTVARLIEGRTSRAACSNVSSGRRTAPLLRLTKFRLQQLEAVTLIREERENGKQQLAYNARPFVLCGIPLRRPPRTQLIHSRRNGRLFLDITGHPEFGLPFGQDRLIPIWVATLAVQQKSRIVHFESAAQMLDFFRLSKDGRHYRRIVQGFHRIFAATIFFGTEDQPNRSRLIDRARFHFFDRMRLWFNNHEPEQSVNDEAYENVIRLSEAFYQEIDQHGIPVEREVIAALAHAPGMLDFYMWVVWKSWTVNRGAAHVPLFGDCGLSHQLGTTEYSARRRFRQILTDWIVKVKALWPECPTEISQDGEYLVVRSSQACPAVRAPQRMGTLHSPYP
jgi:hypothetical protein